MKIAIIGALDEEIKPLFKDIKSVSKEKIGVKTYYRGILYNQQVVFAISGWGKVASSLTTTVLLSRFGADVVLFFGTAGALDPKIKIGDVVIAKELIQHDLDPRPIYPRYQIPHLRMSRIPTDTRLGKLSLIAAKDFVKSGLKQNIDKSILKKFNITNPRVYTGLIGSGDQFISDSSARREIRRRIPGIKCIEMEGASVAQVCYEYNRTPCVIVRIISDAANHDAKFDFPLFISKVAGFYTSGIIRKLFSHF